MLILLKAKKKKKFNVCLNEIDEDGDDEIPASEDVEFGDEDNAVDMTGVPVWRKN